MSINVQNLNFTRYIYQNTFTSSKYRNTFCNPEKMKQGDFDEFLLLNTIYPYGEVINRENKLSVHITIEPFKNCNTLTKDAILYLQTKPTNEDLTGLWFTGLNRTFYGDFYKYDEGGKKIKDFVLFQAVPETKELVIDVYYGYCPKNKSERIKLIKNHLWHKKNHSNVSGLKSFKTLMAL
tara:strand:+ start:3834 stop:4373 length:540 start_codon:yes stop_codon:yes gene_type:complete